MSNRAKQRSGALGGAAIQLINKRTVLTKLIGNAVVEELDAPSDLDGAAFQRRLPEGSILVSSVVGY